MNRTKKLPDAYAKSIDSNNYKLLQLANLLYTDLKCDLTAILELRNLQNAFGKTLDEYGKMAGLSRNGLNDEQYRIKICNQIGRQRSTGNCNDVIILISQMLGVEIDSFSLTERGNAVISITGLTTNVLEKSGFDIKELKNIINGVLPIGVQTDDLTFDGTFELGETYEFNSGKGFGDIQQTIGGTLGITE